MSRAVIWLCQGCRQELGRQTTRAFHPARRVVPIPLTAGGALVVCPWCGTRLEWHAAGTAARPGMVRCG